MVFRRTIWKLVCMAATASLLAGCGGGGESVSGMVPVKGTITMPGTDLAGLAVVFSPIAPAEPKAESKGRAPSASGKIGDGGAFTLGTRAPNDGAIPGEYKVSIIQPADGNNPTPTEDPRLAKIPKAYQDAATTPLKATVAKDGANDLKLELNPNLKADAVGGIAP